MKNSVRYTIGLASFFIAIGMLLMLFVSSTFGAVILITILLVIGYLCLMCD